MLSTFRLGLQRKVKVQQSHKPAFVAYYHIPVAARSTNPDMTTVVFQARQDGRIIETKSKLR